MMKQKRRKQDRSAVTGESGTGRRANQPTFPPAAANPETASASKDNHAGNNTGDAELTAAELRSIRARKAARARWYRDCMGYGAMIKDIQARLERGEDPFAEAAERLRREGKLPPAESTSSHRGDQP